MYEPQCKRLRWELGHHSHGKQCASPPINVLSILLLPLSLGEILVCIWMEGIDLEKEISITIMFD